MRRVWGCLFLSVLWTGSVSFALLGCRRNQYGDKLGIKTQHQSEAGFDAPAGRVMLAVLTSLAIESLAIAEVQQGTTQCLLISDIPAGFVTNRGKINVLMEQLNASVRVSLSTTISAQWHDWGKSKRLQQGLLGQIGADLHQQGFQQEPRRRIA